MQCTFVGSNGHTKENPDSISEVASTEKEKYAFRKTKLYQKLQVDVNIISNSRRFERKRCSPIKRVQKTPSKKRRRVKRCPNGLLDLADKASIGQSSEDFSIAVSLVSLDEESIHAKM